MRDYGTVSPKFWQAGTGRALRGDANAQLLALYLMTSPHSNMIGVYFCTIQSMSYETGIPFEGASKALRRLVDEGFCVFDEETDEVFVTKMAFHQIAERLEAKDNRCKSVARELALVNSSQLQKAFHAVYAGAFNLVTPPAQPVDKSPDMKPLRSPFEAPSKPGAGAGAGAGAGTRAGAGARASPAGCAGTPPAIFFPPDFAKVAATERPDLDPKPVYANFCDHYDEPKRTLTLWKKWVRREHGGAAPPGGAGTGRTAITVPGPTGPDPELERIKADRVRAVPMPDSVRAAIQAAKRAAA